MSSSSNPSKVALECIADLWRRCGTDLDKCDDKYPHRCPHCAAAAFVGLIKVDCKRRCDGSKGRPV